MLKKLRKKIEDKRTSKNFLWRVLVLGKDSAWKIHKAISLRRVLKKITNFLKEKRRISWETDKKAVEIELTSFCNLRCINCNRSVGPAPTGEFMDLKQIEKFVEESIDLNWGWERIRLLGGEPTLHPQFPEIIKIIKRYKDFHQEVNIEVVTNGYGKKVRTILSGLPAWLYVANSNKKSSLQRFASYNIAPVDLEEYRGMDFSKGCYVTERCGLGLTRYGYYICGPGASIDRVYGFNIGMKKISQLSNSKLKEQRKILCQYCGHYKYNSPRDKKTWIISAEMSLSWIKAYERYAEQKPEMPLY